MGESGIAAFFMRYWFDTEFIDTGRVIELISIGIVAEDGREYYAISNEFNAAEANGWVKEHVLVHLPPREDPHWKSRAQIRDEVQAFMSDPSPEIWAYNASYDWVVLSQLFGPMTDVPRNWPNHCMDVKQWRIFLGWPRVPKQEGAMHDAREDARWNRQVWQFLDSIKALPPSC